MLILRGPVVSRLSEDRESRTTAPWWPLAGAAFSAALAVLLFVVNAGDLNSLSVIELVIGYATGALVSVLFIALYRAKRNTLRAHPRFRPQPQLDRAMIAVLTIGVAAGIGCAVLLALELAKQ